MTTNRPLKVLILEDVQSDAELMVHELKQAGFLPDWRRVDTKEQYLSSLESNPDLILSDYNLPQFDAFLALQLMQEQKLDIPFVVISGAITEDVAVEFMKQGASDYLLKDRMARLGQAVVRALEQRELREEKRRTGEALRESEERFRHVSELITDFAYYCMKSPDGPFIIDWMTGAVEKITGYTADEIHDMTGWRPLVVEDDIPIFDRNVVGLSLGEWARSEIRIRKKDGEVIWLASFAQCLPDHQNPSYHRIYGGCRDITERKRAEAALVKKSEDLARSNADLEKFAYVASHDLQEPLRTITSFAQLLQKRYHGKLDSDADEFIGFIVGGTKRMQQLINDLLTYSRVNTRRAPLCPMKIGDALHSALQNLRYVLEESGGTVIFEEEEMPTIVADEPQMTQLFQNLIGNALKFQGEEVPRVEISVALNGNEWVFSVRDNGIGIDPKYKDRIFEIFQRLHTREEYPGTGIGLAIAKKIVERYDGRIWVESKPGKGSTFYFTIPRTPARS